jgi:hypothetical protein
MLSD